jgi:hypothetical protein
MLNACAHQTTTMQSLIYSHATLDVLYNLLYHISNRTLSVNQYELQHPYYPAIPTGRQTYTQMQAQQSDKQMITTEHLNY